MLNQTFKVLFIIKYILNESKPGRFSSTKKRFAWECEAFFVFGWKRWIFMYQLIFTKFHKKNKTEL